MRTCAPAAAASLTAFSAVAVLAALSSPHSIWHAATLNFGSATASDALVKELIEVSIFECQQGNTALPTRLPAEPVRVAATDFRTVGQRNAEVARVFIAREKASAARPGLRTNAAARPVFVLGAAKNINVLSYQDPRKVSNATNDGCDHRPETPEAQ